MSSCGLESLKTSDIGKENLQFHLKMDLGQRQVYLWKIPMTMGPQGTGQVPVFLVQVSILSLH